MKNVAIFASGSGTNAENIARYFSKSETVKVAVVLSNNKNVGVHARVNNLGIPSFVFSRDEFVEGTPILAKLAEYQIDLIVLAGFMNKISDALLTAYPGKIINIHPALLPKHVHAVQKLWGKIFNFILRYVTTNEISAFF